MTARAPNKRQPNVFTVPKGIKPTECRGINCGAVVYWISHPETGRSHPIDCEHDGCFPPTSREDGLGISHFATCPDAEQFRKRKPREVR